MTRIEDLAERLREQLGIPDDMRPDALDVLRRMKIAKVISDFGQDSSAVGRDARWDSDGRVVYFSPELWQAVQDDNDPDARFTAFHEIGHAVLGHTHRNRRTLGKTQFGRFIESDEADADLFALALSVPLKFADIAATLDAAALAKEFGLTSFHASRRLVDLQRHLRWSVAQNGEAEQDTYADAMRAMRANAISWNS